MRVVAPPNRQVHRGSEDLSLNMHSQAEHELHTSSGKKGRGKRRDTRWAFSQQPRRLSAAQGSTLLQAGYARIGERGLIGGFGCTE
jgi:hypothetical protein